MASPPPATTTATPAQPLRAAAGALWVLAGLEIAAFGACGLILFRLGLFTGTAAEAWAPRAGEVPSPTMTVASLVMLGLGPALLLVLLGFGVRQGQGLWIVTALAIVLVQAFALALLLAVQAVQALRAGEPSMLTFLVLGLGTPLVIAAWVALLLLRAWSVASPVAAEHAGEPEA